MLNVYHSPATFFSPFLSSTAWTLNNSSVAAGSLPFTASLSRCSYCYRCYIQSFGLFRVIGFQYPVVAQGLVICAQCTLPCKNSRLLCSCCIKWPFSYLVRWLSYIWNSNVKAYLCNRWYSISFSLRLACHILNPAHRHGITPIPTYIHTHLEVEADYIMEKVGSRVAPSSLHSSGGISNLETTRDGSVSILTYQAMSALLHLAKSTISRSFEV